MIRSRSARSVPPQARPAGSLVRVALAVGLLVLNLVVPARPSAADFLPPFPTYDTGASPQCVAVGDLNADGIPDIVTTNFTPGGVSILLGNGAGGYAAHTDIATGADARCVAIADMNGDAVPDLLVVNYSPHTLSIMVGNGDGTFGPKEDFNCASGPQALAVGDLNGDGRMDVTVANLLANTVSVFLGSGSGSVGSRTDWAVGNGPRSHVLLDVNGDGRLDVVTANSGSSTISLLPGNGAGGFGTRTNFVTGASPRAVAAGDLNGDGRPDLAVPNASGNSVSVFIQNAGGGFAPRVDYSTGGTPQHATIADFTGDGRPDVAVAKSLLNVVAILPGNGDGTLGSATEYATGSNPLWVVAAQLNADGAPDLVVANSASNSVSVALNTGPAPHVAVSPASLDFGTGYLGQPGTLALRVSNAGTLPLNVSSLTVGGAEFSFSGPAAFALAPGAHLDVPVTYARATVGTANGTLTIASDDPTTPSKVVSLAGVTTYAPLADVSPDSLLLSALVGTTTSGTITVSNSGLGTMSYTVSAPGGLPPWLSYSPGGGTVNPSSSAAVTVGGNAIGLSAGDYWSALRISTTDTAHPTFDVPVFLHVFGQPGISVTPSALDFGTGFVGQRDSLRLRVSNFGSDNLTVSSVTVDATAFTVDGPTSFVVAPFGSVEVSISYPRTASGTASGTLTIASNAVGAPTTLVPVTGVALPAPVIEVNPESLYVVLPADDSTNTSFTLSNAGESPLTYQVGSTGQPLDMPQAASQADSIFSRGVPGPGAAPAPPPSAATALRTLSAGPGAQGSVLILGDGASEGDVGATLSAAGYSVTYVPFAPTYWNGSNPSPQGFSLVVLLDGLTYGQDYSSTAQTALLSYVDGGGGLVISEWAAFEVLYGRYQILAPLVPVTRTSGSTGSVTNYVVADHPVTAGVDPSFLTTSGFGIGFLNSGQTLVQLGDGTPMVVAKQYGAGRVVYFAHAGSYEGFHPFLAPSMQRLVANAAMWTSGNSWLTVEPASGTLNPGESAQVHLDISSRRLVGGRYDSAVRVSSNDPIRPTLFVPVRLDVTGIPQIAVAPESLDFGSRFVGQPDSLLLRVRSTGSGILHVSSITTGSAEFAVEGPGAFEVNPGAFRDVRVWYLRTAAGTANGTLTIASDDVANPSVVVPLTGVATEPPVAHLSPDSLNFTVASGSAGTITVTLRNDGLGSLDYHVDPFFNAPWWLQWTGGTGTLAPGTSVEIPFTANAAGLYAGFYQGFLWVQTNDPLRSMIGLMANLTVTGEGVLTVTPSPLDFGIGYLGFPASRTLALQNTGTAAITVGHVSATAGFQVADSGFVIPPAVSANLIVRDFHAALGTETGTLTIDSDAQGHPTLVPLTGVTLRPPVIAVAPDSFAFEMVSGESASAALTVRNDGESDLEILIGGGADSTSLVALRGAHRQDLSTLLPTLPVTSKLAMVPGREATVLGSNVVRAVNAGSSTLVIATSDLSGSVERALGELGVGHDYVFASNFASVDYSPYSTIIVGITGDYVSPGSVQALAAAVAAGRLLIMIGGTDDYYFYQELQSYLLQHTGQTGWTLSAPPHLQVVSPYDELAAGLPSPLNYTNGYPAYYMLRISDPAAAVVARNGDGWPVLVRKSLGAGELIYFTSPAHTFFWTDESDYQVLRQILSNALQYSSAPWLSVTPHSATIPAHTSLDLEVLARSAGLNDGSYHAWLRVHSNDPVTPEVGLPVRLRVHGVPQIAASPTPLDFGTRFVGQPDSLPLAVINPGTATLHVSGMTLAGAQFSLAGPTSFDLGPGDSTYVLVGYTRSAVGPASGTISIASDAASSPTLVVPLAGVALEPPVIAVAPSSFAFEIAAGESASAPLVVRNDGASDLQVRIARNGSSVGVLALAKAHRPDLAALVSSSAAKVPVGATPGAAAVRSAARMAAGGTGTLVLTTTSIGSSVERALGELGESYDLVYTESFDTVDLTPYSTIVVAMNGGYVLEPALQALANAAAGGRRLVMVGGSNLPPYYNGMQAYLLKHTGEQGWITTGAPHLRVVDRTDPLAAGLPDSVSYSDYGASFYMLRINDPDATVVAVNGHGYPALVHKAIGAGELVYFTSPPSDYFWSYSSDYSVLRQVLENALHFGGTRWLSVVPDSAVVPAHSSATLDVRASAAQLVDGIYQGRVEVRSNDPVSPLVNVPVQLTVHGTPQIAASPDTLDFGAGLLGQGDSLAVRVTNAGTALLNVSGMTASGGEFTIDGPTAFSLAPAAWRDVPVRYARSALGIASGALTIASDDPARPSVAVVLRGETVEPPVASVTPDSLHLTLAVGDTAGSNLVIRNAGPGPLTWALSFDGPAAPWLSFAPPQGVVGPGAEQQARVMVDAGLLAPGTYQVGLRVDTDDPNHAPFHVTVVAEVLGGPTPTELSLVRTDVSAERVELEWYSSDRNVRFALYRRDVAADWAKLCDLTSDGTGRIAYEDRAIAPGGRYGYRLGVMEAGTVQWYGEAWIDVPIPVLALHGAFPNPARSDLSVAFSLASRAPATLEVFDVTGRLVAARAVGSLGPGRHVVRFGQGRPVERGVYLLRLTTGGKCFTAKTAVLN